MGNLLSLACHDDRQEVGHGTSSYGEDAPVVRDQWHTLGIGTGGRGFLFDP